ncbi:MAG: glutathione S-transferase family protein [Microcoleaceae cyanobacterium]
MLKFYHVPLSSNGRRVWILLLEKGLEFEEVRMKLDGDHLTPEFLALNPFHHIPVLTDDDFTVIESLAIMDYLEAKYPSPGFTPTDAPSLAKMRMIQLVTANELLPTLFPILRNRLDLPEEPGKSLKAAQDQAATVLDFYQKHLGDSSYLVGDQFTLADMVAVTMFLDLRFMGFSMENYPKLQAWCDRLLERESVQKTTPTNEEIDVAYASIKKMLEG